MSTYGTQAWGTSGWGIAGAGLATSSDAAICPTTTWAAIRANMATVIDALTPTVLRSTSFALSDHETDDFRSWAEENDSAAFRRYEIEALLHERASAENLLVQLRRTECELVICYPTRSALYRTKHSGKTRNAGAMHAVIESDVNQILKAVGSRGAANYLAGQHSAVETDWSDESGEGVRFAVLPFEVFYYFDAD